MTEALVDVLSFLSDDDYGFVFSKLDHPPPVQLYFENLVPDFAVDEVALFSGGLDSLAGSIQTALVDGRKVALISHTSAPKRKPQIAGLAADVATRATVGAVQHIPVWATKAEAIGREYTQRSRSFLYAALAATVASMLGHDRIRFYENGVTSLNLPIAPQVVGGRGTRTTHPQAIRGFARLFTALLARPFTEENPFIWKTKTDVARLIKDHDCGSLVARSVSCSKTVEATRLHTHCGRCSQCIDRRFATLAAGLSDKEDPVEMYKVDLLTGERTFGENRAMAESFLQRAAPKQPAEQMAGRALWSSSAAKFSKTITTWFFPVGGVFRQIVVDWVTYLEKEKLWAKDDPLFPGTDIDQDAERRFVVKGIERKHWSSAGPIRQIFKSAFEQASLPYYNPHSFRKTLVQLAFEIELPPEQLKAWSQNLGHEGVLTTFTSYGSVARHRQAEIMRGLADPQAPTTDEELIRKIAEKVFRRKSRAE